MRNEKYAGFELVSGLRHEVADLIRRQIEVARNMGIPAQHARWLGPLENLAQLVEQDTFKVLIVGQFSRGKSTLINALLGQEVLPAYATETTAIVTTVKFAEVAAAQVYPRVSSDNPRPVPERVPVDNLEEYVRVRDDHDPEPNPYVRADVFWPLDLCRNGVELVDSPGLDAISEAREKETLDYLTKVDAVVMVLDAQAAMTRSELNFYWDMIVPLGHEDIFWVVNKIDLVGNDRTLVEGHVRKELGDIVHSDDRIHFVDSRGALQAKAQDNSTYLAASGLPRLEKNLQNFLTVHRGNAKVLLPVRQLNQSIRELRDAIHLEERLLDRNLDDLVDAEFRAALPLAGMEKTVSYLCDKLERELGATSTLVEREAQAFFDQLISEIPRKVKEVRPRTQLSFDPRQFNQSVSRRSTELVNVVHEKLQREVAGWTSGKLKTLIRNSLEGVQSDIQDEVRDFEDSLRGLKLDWSAGPFKDRPTFSIGKADAAGYGAERATLSLAGLGATSVLKGAVSGGATFALGSVAVGALGITLLAPLVLPTAFIIMLFNIRMKPKEAIEQRIQARVIEGMQNQIRQASPQVLSRIVTESDDYFSHITAEFRSFLTSQVATLRQEVADALSAKKKGQEEVERRRHQMVALIEELESIEAAADRIMNQIVSPERS